MDGLILSQTLRIGRCTSMPISHSSKQKLIRFLFRLRLGRDVWASDEARLKKYGIGLITRSEACDVALPAAPSAEEGGPPVMPAMSMHYAPCQVLKLDYATHGDCVKRWGTIVLSRGRALQTGINYHTARLAAIMPPTFGKKRREDLIVAAWPHSFMSYGDFCMCVLPRVCRALSVLSEKERAKACVALPYSIGDWSRQYLEIVGIPRERQIDTLKEKFGLSKGGEVVTVNDSPGLWAPPSDIADMLAMIPPPPACGKKRYLIQRKGSRFLKNEKELLASIRDLGFELLPDAPRTVREQIDLYKEVECVVGPHGAGLSNILWAGSGARFLEVQSVSWMMPSFRCLCAIRKFPYRLIIDKSAGGEPRLEGICSTAPLEVDTALFQKHVGLLCSSR